MAKLNGLRAAWSMSNINEYIQDKLQDFEADAITVLQYKGEEFVNKARNIRTYQDRTGNLRASIGYVIIKDGRIIREDYAESPRGSDRLSGIGEARVFIDRMLAEFSEGLILVGFAGMHYAAYVEAKGYDVITGSAPTNSEIRDLFNAIKF